MIALPAQEYVKKYQAHKPDGGGVDEVLQHNVLIGIYYLLGILLQLNQLIALLKDGQM